MGRDTGVDDASEIRTQKRKRPAAPTKAGGASSLEYLWQREPFPLAVFPPAVGQFLAAVGQSVQVPPDIPASAALVVAGSAVGATRRFAFRRDWLATANLFLASVAPSGAGKSPAVRQVQSPLRVAQKFFHLESQALRELYAVMLAEATENDLPPPPEPRPAPRLWLDDTTIEALIDRLSKNPRGFLVYRDELAGWVRSMDAYRSGRGGDRQRWLSLFDGDAITVDRKSDGAEVYLPNPCVALLGSIQPSMLDVLADKELREDGLLPRFLYCYPPDVKDDCDYSNAAVEDRLTLAWRNTVFRLLRQQFAPGLEPQVVNPRRDVEAVYQRWYDASNAEMRHPDFPSHLRPVWSKLRVLVLRIALILHQLDVATAAPDVDPYELTGGHLSRAVQVVEWAKRQAVAVFSSLHQDGTSRQVELLTGWVRRKVEPDDAGIRRVSVREMQRYKVAGLTSASEIRKLCLHAADRGQGTFDTSSNTYTLAGSEKE